MLKSLLIENYALIEKLDISFDEGLTIITGETGAGKSILLGALGLILGQRADTRVLLNKETKCIIEGTFDLGDLQIENLFQENELDYDAITIFRREITPQGKSRAFINDTPVNLQLLKIFAERLIDIHSQHQSLLFANSAFRYELVDAWAGITKTISIYRKKYSSLQSTRKLLEKLREQERQSRAELDYFSFQFDELHKAALIPGEMDDIGAELEILNNAGEIKYNLEKAGYLLQDSPENILSIINELTGLFKSLENFDPAYAAILNRLQSTSIELKDIAQEAAGLKEDVSDDPGRATELQDRFDLLQKLLHKHNAANIEELMAVRDDFKSRIDTFDSLEEQIANTENELAQKDQELTSLAREISQKRQKAIPGLEKEIDGILKELSIPNGRFVAALEKKESLFPNGSDEIDLLFSANLGSPLQELSKVASGGELSRLMLAVKSVISLKNLLPTIIFDEIDSGVSGEVALKMGTILEKISNTMQVISVTHLPQIAARGRKQFVVYKHIENQITKTYVKELSTRERVEEIARMLGGENPGPAVFQAAEELFNKQNSNKI